MNYTAGLLAFALLWIPSIGILIWLHNQNKKIDAEYKEKLADIKKRYGVE